MMFSATPSRASSSACAWRSWCGAKRRRTPARAASRRSATRTPAPRARLFAAPSVHADLAAAAALAVAHEHRSAPRVEVALGERECLLHAQATAPEHDDQCPQPPAMAIVGGLAHDRDDLLHARRVSRVTLSL